MDKQLLVAIFKPIHGLFNLLVLALLVVHAGEGIRIRRARLNHREVPLSAVKRHRSLGPGVAFLALAGYLAGIGLVLYDKGNILEHPLHLATGSFAMLFLLATFLLSRRIQGFAPTLRTWHFLFGISVLILCVAEVILGLSILF